MKKIEEGDKLLKVIANAQAFETYNFIDQIANVLSCMIHVVDVYGHKMLYGDRKVVEELDYTPEEVIEILLTGILSFHHPDDRNRLINFRNRIAKAKDNAVYIYKGRMLGKKGNWAWLKFISKVFKRNTDREATYFLVISRNGYMNEQKEAYKKIRELDLLLTDKNKLLEYLTSESTTLSGIVLKDFKEMLENIYIALEFITITEAGKFSDAGKAKMRKAQAGIQKLRLLNEDIISYTGITLPGKAKFPVDLNEILISVLRRLNIKIEETKAIIESGLLPIISGFNQLISLLFYHLLDNAIKFRQKDFSPVIKITYQQSTAPPGITGLPNEKKYIELSVADNGIGFGKSESESMFDIYRLNDKGKYIHSGVGLAICSKIMNLHNGFIIGESIPGKGSVFNCFFPL